jgi:hypothetical protein
MPAIERDRSYITKKGYEVVTRGGELVTNGPISDDILQRLRDGTWQFASGRVRAMRSGL